MTVPNVYDTRPYSSVRTLRCMHQQGSKLHQGSKRQKGSGRSQTYDVRENKQFMTATGCNIFSNLQQNSQLLLGDQGSTEDQHQHVPSSLLQSKKSSLTKSNKHIDFNVDSGWNGFKPISTCCSSKKELNDDDTVRNNYNEKDTLLEIRTDSPDHDNDLHTTGAFIQQQQQQHLAGPSKYLNFTYYQDRQKKNGFINSSFNYDLATEETQNSLTSDRPYSSKSCHIHNPPKYPQYKYQLYFEKFNQARELFDPEDSYIYNNINSNSNSRKESSSRSREGSIGSMGSMFGFDDNLFPISNEQGFGDSIAYTDNTSQIQCNDMERHCSCPSKSSKSVEVKLETSGSASPISHPINHEPFGKHNETHSHTNACPVDERPQQQSNHGCKQEVCTQEICTQSDEYDTEEIVCQHLDRTSDSYALSPVNTVNTHETSIIAQGTSKLSPETKMSSKEEPLNLIDSDKYWKICDRAGKTYVCNYENCGKSFQSRYNVRSHIHSHMQLRQFMCGLCHRRYYRSHDLTRHLRQHNISYTKTTESNKKFRRFANSTCKWLEYITPSDSCNSPNTD